MIDDAKLDARIEALLEFWADKLELQDVHVHYSYEVLDDARAKCAPRTPRTRSEAELVIDRTYLEGASCEELFETIGHEMAHILQWPSIYCLDPWADNVLQPWWKTLIWPAFEWGHEATTEKLTRVLMKGHQPTEELRRLWAE